MFLGEYEELSSLRKKIQETLERLLAAISLMSKNPDKREEETTVCFKFTSRRSKDGEECDLSIAFGSFLVI